MTIKQDLIEPFNAQIRSEFTASAQYISIAAYFDEIGLLELAQFFFRQSDEERVHAMKFVRFMLDTDTKPIIPDTPELRNSFESPEDAIRFALDQEKTVTAQIDNLVRLAVADSDYASHNFLQWFVTEQVEEVDTMTKLLQTIRLAGENLLLADDYVGRYLQGVGGEA